MPVDPPPKQTRTHGKGKKVADDTASSSQTTRHRAQPQTRRTSPPTKYLFYPAQEDDSIDLIRCNVWVRDGTTNMQSHVSTIRTGWIKPPPDARADDICRRTDIRMERSGVVAAQIHWRNGTLHSVFVQNTEAIVRRKRLSSGKIHPNPEGFSWPDGHRFFTWEPLDTSVSISGIIRNGNKIAQVRYNPGYIVLEPVFASYEKLEILLLCAIVGSFVRGMLQLEMEDDEEFQQEVLQWLK